MKEVEGKVFNHSHQWSIDHLRFSHNIWMQNWNSHLKTLTSFHVLLACLLPFFFWHVLQNGRHAEHMLTSFLCGGFEARSKMKNCAVWFKWLPLSSNPHEQLSLFFCHMQCVTAARTSTETLAVCSSSISQGKCRSVISGSCSSSPMHFQEWNGIWFHVTRLTLVSVTSQVKKSHIWHAERTHGRWRWRSSV